MWVIDLTEGHLVLLFDQMFSSSVLESKDWRVYEGVCSLRLQTGHAGHGGHGGHVGHACHGCIIFLCG